MANDNLAITVQSLVGTSTGSFSFNSPVVSDLGPSNLATTGGAQITLFGVNFGMLATTPTTRLGSTVCETSSWTSDTHVVCTGKAGSKTAHPVMITMSSLVGTALGMFSFDAPVISAINQPSGVSFNGPTSGGQPVTLLGINFDTAEDNTASVSLLGKPVGTASWTTSTLIKFYTPSSSATSTVLSTVTINSVVGTINNIFTYDSPVITKLTPINTAVSLGSGSQLTLHGLNFGATDLTMSVDIGYKKICLSNTWVSGTSVVCIPPATTGVKQSIAVTISSAAGTSVSSFSFDAPVASQTINANTPTSGFSSLTVHGLNFANVDVTASLQIGHSICGTTSWSTSTTLTCFSMRGSNLPSGIHTPVTISTIVGTLKASFSYDTPVLSQGTPPNSPTTGGASLTVYGMNFGQVDFSPTVALGGSACETTVWNSDSAVKCLHVKSGIGTFRTGVTLSRLVGSHMNVFTYDAPGASQAFRHNNPSCGGGSVTLIGFNFGTYLSDITPSVRIGSSACGTSSWTSMTTVKCMLSSGTGGALDAGVTVNSLVGTLTSAFTFDSPVISTFGVTNSPQSGGTAVTVYGTNLGLGDFTPSARIGSTMCRSTVWGSETSIVCTSAGGSSRTLDVFLTVGAIVATQEDVFSFDSPVLSFTQLYNMPTTAGGQVTVEGVNFGPSDFTPTVRIQSTVCSTASWSTTTSVVCVASSGYGISRKLAVTIASYAGTALGIFSFDSPMVTGLSLGNAPTTGGKSMTIQGSNFAIEDGTVTALVGASMCATTSWTTSSVVTCLLGGASAGADYQVAVTLVGLIGTKQKIFSYDSPVITLLNNANGPTMGSSSMHTMSGTNFAANDYTLSSIIGTTGCLSTSWISVTSATCRITPGFGPSHTATLTVQNLVATANLAFTYDSPVVTYAEPYNAPNSAGISVTLSGTNFGSTDLSVTIQVAETACSRSQWISGTSATCGLREGVGVGPSSRVSEHRVAITVGTGVGTRTRSFTFDAPVVTSAARLNLPSTGGETVTVQGVNFGLSDYSATVGVGKTACMTSAWSSLTSVNCGSPPGGGAGYGIAVTVVDVAGSLSNAFSFDSPVLSSVIGSNGPVSHGAVLTLHGAGFGLADNTPSVHIARTACGSISWTSISTLACYTPNGSGQGYEQSVTVSALVGTVSGSFTYDAPIVSDIRGYNGAITGGSSLTVSGTNFGTTDMSPTVRIASVACSTSVFVSSTQLRCQSAGGYGYNQPMDVVLDGLLGTLLKAFSFDAPVVSDSQSGNSPTTAGPRLTISGSDFGQMNLTPTAKVGKTRCATTSWMSATSLHCSVGLGMGKALTAAAELFDLTGCLDSMFTYDSPVISQVTDNAATSGGASVTIRGFNLGHEEPTMTARIGSTSCAQSRWVSDTSAICLVPVGSGTAATLSTTIASIAGTLVSKYSFDTPALTGFVQANAPTTSGAYLTVLGLNFVAEDLTTSLTMSSGTCTTSSWSSSTTLSCKSLAGYGLAQNIGLTIHAQVGTGLGLVTFDAPVLTSMISTNVAMSGGPTLTVNGINFLSTDFTPITAIGLTTCGSTSWSSITSVQCSSTGINGNGAKSITSILSTVVGTAYLAFSYDSPAASHVTTLNSASSGQTTITVSGLNFFSNDDTPTVYVGGAACSDTTWTAATTLLCVNSASSGGAQSVAAELNSHIGTLAATFSFDAPAMSHATAENFPTSGGAAISLSGTNFGMSDFTPSVKVGTAMCSTATWTTTTRVLCTSPAGYLPSGVAPQYPDTSTLPGFLSISSVVGTVSTQTFTYDAPVVTFLSAFNSPTSQGAVLTVHGTNFYTSDTTASVHVAGNACSTTSWSTSTALSCVVPTNVGLSATVQTIINQNPLDSLYSAGTLVTAFSYDAPVVTHLTGSANAPASAAALVTFSGTNFGMVDYSATTMIGSVLCDSTVWVAQTQVKCAVKAGYGTNKSANLALASQTATLEASFTYDTPVITHVARFNAPTSGLASITLTGFNFVTAFDPTPSARFGPTGCGTMSWSTDTAVSCLSPVGSGMSQLVSVSLVNTVGTISSIFTYDAPLVTLVTAANAPLSGGAAATILGSNFAFAAGTSAGLNVLIGGRQCSESVQLSDTSIRCKPSMGSDKALDLHLTVSGIMGTSMSVFTYDAPAVTATSVFNAVTTGATTVLISGVNLGPVDYSPTARVGVSLCLTTSWNSDTTMSCSVSPGSGGTHSIDVEVAQLMGTMQGMFSYDSPIVTNVALSNAPVSTGLTMSVHGANFGVANHYPTVYVGPSKCATTVWISASELRCGIGVSGNGVTQKVSAEVSSLVGTALSLFTYDAPVVTVTSGVNAPTTGDIVVTIDGMNFGYQDFQGAASVGRTACDTTTYLSDSSVSCKIPSGSGRTNMMFGHSGQSGTMVRAFSYDAPVVTHSSPYNGPMKAGAVVTVEGSNFGPAGSSSTALVGISFCMNSEWLTTTTVKCTTPHGTGNGYQINLVENGNVGTQTGRFSYDAPIVSHLDPANGPTAGVLLTVTGMNFASRDVSATVAVGPSVCPAVTWVSDSALVCTTPVITDSSVYAVLLTVATGSDVSAASFQADSPVLTAFAPSNGPAAGGTVVTISGQNFGTAALAVDTSSSVQGVACSASTFVSGTSLLCTTPAGSGIGQDIGATVSNLTGVGSNAFNYDGPTIASVSPANGLYIGMTPITVTGTNFASAATVKVGVTSCAQTTFVTSTSITCTASPPSNDTEIQLPFAGFPVTVDVSGLVSTTPDAFSLNGPTTGLDGTVTGLVLTSSSFTVIQVANETSYSKYAFTDTPALNGVLYLEFASGYSPSRTAVFTVFESTTGTAFTGSFTSVQTNREEVTASATIANDKIEIRVQIPGCNTTLACYGHGTCSETTGVCACDQGYAGTNCETACYYSKNEAKFICGCGDKLDGQCLVPGGQCD
jgi:hypothetical protein